MMARALVVTFAVLMWSGASSAPSSTSWKPLPHPVRLSLPHIRALQAECDNWFCSWQDGDTLYCYEEGTTLDTPCCTFVCRCEAQGTDGYTFALLSGFR